MSTDPKRMNPDGSERRPSGSESKGDARGASGGHRSSAGSDYGDWVPDRGQPRANDDRDAGVGGYYTGGGDLDKMGRQPEADRAKADEAARGTPENTPSADSAAEAERQAEDNRNKDFDTPHVHSSTTSRKV